LRLRAPRFIKRGATIKIGGRRGKPQRIFQAAPRPRADRHNLPVINSLLQRELVGGVCGEMAVL